MIPVKVIGQSVISLQSPHNHFLNGGLAVIKLNILNMKEFFQTVNTCNGAVNLLYPDGKKENINRQYELQKELLHKYRENKNHLQLSLDIPDPKDYMSIVYYYAGDC